MQDFERLAGLSSGLAKDLFLRVYRPKHIELVVDDSDSADSQHEFNHFYKDHPSLSRDIITEFNSQNIIIFHN